MSETTVTFAAATGKPSPAGTPAPVAPDITVMPKTRAEFDALPDEAKYKWVTVWSTPGGPPMPFDAGTNPSPTPAATPAASRPSTVTFEPPKRLGGPETGGAVRAEAAIPWYVRYPEEAGRMLGFYGGELTGALAGGAMGAGAGALAAPVTGPLGPIGGAVTGGLIGKAAGGTTGATLVDIAIDKINQKLYNRPPEFTGWQDIKDDAEINGLASAIGIPVGALVDAAAARSLQRMRSFPELRQAATEQAGKAEEVGQAATIAEGGGPGVVGKQGEERFRVSQEVQAAKARHEQVRGEAQQQVSEASQKVHDKAREDIAKESQRRIKEEAPEQRVRVMAQSTGVSPEATEATRLAPSEVTPEGVTVPGEQFVKRRVAFYDTAYGPYRKVADAMDTAYKKHYANHLDIVPPAESDQLGAEVADQQAYAQGASARGESATFSSSANRLLKDAEDLSNSAKLGAGTKKPISEMDDWTAIATLRSVKEANQYLKGPPEALRLQGQLARRTLEGAEKGFGAQITGEVEPATIRRYLKVRSDARALLGSPSASGTDRQLAASIIDGVDKTLAKSNVPGSEALDARYRTFKTLFNKDYFRSISTASDPIDAAPKFFTNPQRLRLLWDNGTPEQRQYMRELYGHMVNMTQGKGVDLADHKEFLQRAFPGTPLAKPEAWIHVDPKLEKFAETVTSSPQVSQRFINDVGANAQRQVADIEQKAAIKIRDDALGDLKRLGPLGQKAIVRINAAAGDPRKQADIAIEVMTGMTPEQAVNELAATQPPPASVGAEAIESMRQPLKTATGQPMLPARTPQQAGVQSIQAGVLPKGAQASNWLSKRWKLYGMMMASSFLIGRVPNSWIMGMTGLGGAGFAKDALKKELTDRFIKTLADNPAEAAKFFAATGNYGVKSSWDYLTNQTAKGLVDQALASQMARSGLTYTGAMTPPQPKPVTTSMPKATATPTAKPTPMAKHIEAARATAIAGPHAPTAKVDAIKDVSKKVAAPGKPADVHRDLTSGRVSLGHVRKMLDSGGTDLASVFKGLSPSDAIETLARANPQEKEAFLPVVAQLINDKGKQMPPQEQQMLMAQLKAVMNQPEATA